MMLKEFNLGSYLFGDGTEALPAAQKELIEAKVRNEMTEIFYGMNIVK